MYTGFATPSLAGKTVLHDDSINETRYEKKTVGRSVFVQNPAIFRSSVVTPHKKKLVATLGAIDKSPKTIGTNFINLKTKLDFTPKQTRTFEKVTFKTCTPSMKDDDIKELIRRYPKQDSTAEHKISFEKTDLQKQTELL
jgi:hypothetical protein